MSEKESFVGFFFIVCFDLFVFRCHLSPVISETE